MARDLQPFFGTREAGPIVAEVPPADDGVINGTLMDAWQSPLVNDGTRGHGPDRPPGNRPQAGLLNL